MPRRPTPPDDDEPAATPVVRRAADELRYQIGELGVFLDTPAAKKAVVGYVQGVKLLTSLSVQLDELENGVAGGAPVDETETMTDEELLTALVAAVEALPDLALDRVIEAVERRRPRTSAPPLRVIG